MRFSPLLWRARPPTFPPPVTSKVVFGAAAGLLAALGVYGLFSWWVALRTRALAIRLTLGERPVGVGIRVIRQSLMLIGAGLIAGLTMIYLAEGALRRVRSKCRHAIRPRLRRPARCS